MFGDFDFSGGLHDPGGSNSTDDHGCLWHVVSFGIFAAVVTALVKWIT